MGGYPLLDSGRTSEGTLPLLYDLLDQLPVSVAVHGTEEVEEDFPLLFRNGRARDRLSGVPSGEALLRLRHPRLRDLVVQVRQSRQPALVELGVPGHGGALLTWEWTMSPLLDDRGELVGLVSVVEDLSRPLLARRRMENAVDQGLHLLLEIARLAEERSEVDDFLAALAERLALLVKAHRVTFDDYDAAHKALVPRARPGGGAVPAEPILPCDPDASDLLSQVVFAGRVYRGTLDLDRLDFRPYASLTGLRRETGSRVLLVPWRAGNERLGAVVARGTDRPDGFTHENAVVLIAAGHAAGLVCRHKQAEQRLAERARELESLERAKSAFLRLASHELRTPLTLINGYVSMLADGSVPPERMPDVLPILERAVGRMNDLVTQLTDAVRLEASQLQLQTEAVDLRTVVQSAAGRVVARWQREADFELRQPGAPAWVIVDVARIGKVIEDLVDNACKYSEPGSPVRCELHADGTVARLVVQDEGIGMSDEEMTGLFTRFGRIVNPRNSHTTGTGLGLFLSREIVRLHGGDITAASVATGGSRFELVVPLGPAGDTQGDARGLVGLR